ncbi:MAG: hypothetical protein KBD24_03935 [Candidatus Pacebacteria bacterium]|nr:hypothetical protein [Candidatus Paceibacterota bacterium]
MSRDYYIGGNSVAVFLATCLAVAGYVGDDLWNGLLWKILFPAFFSYGYWWLWQLHKSRRIQYGIRPAATLLVVAVVSYMVGVLEEWCWIFSLGWDCRSFFNLFGWHQAAATPAFLIVLFSPLYTVLWFLNVSASRGRHKALHQFMLLCCALGSITLVGFLLSLVIAFGYLNQSFFGMM